MEEETVRKVAKVARLELTEEEVKQFATDLEDILQYFSILDEAPELSEFDFNPVKVEKALREDEVHNFRDVPKLKEQMHTTDDWVRGPRLS